MRKLPRNRIPARALTQSEYEKNGLFVAFGMANCDIPV